MYASKAGKAAPGGTGLWAMVKANEKLHLAWCVIGVVGCLMLYGVLQVSAEHRAEHTPGAPRSSYGPS